MLKIYIEKINPYGTFTGYIYKDELTEQQKMLFPGNSDTIDIDGDYDFKLNGRYKADITIKNIVAFGGKNQLLLERVDINADELENEIAESSNYSVWAEMEGNYFNSEDYS